MTNERNASNTRIEISSEVRTQGRDERNANKEHKRKKEEGGNQREGGTKKLPLRMSGELWTVIV